MKNYKSILATLFSAVLLFVCSCSNNTSLKTKVKMSFPVQHFYSVLTARGVEQDSVTINLDVEFYVDNTLYASQSKLVDQNKTSESFIFNGIEFGSTVYAKAEVKSVTVRDGKTYENQMLYGESETITVETEFVELPLTLRWVENQEEKPIQIEVTTSKLKSEIQNYIPGIKTIYKVKGQMTNSEFSELQELIENKSDNDWGGEYVGLDLSEVTGLTRIDCTWGFISLTIPSSVTEFGNYAQFDCVKILEGNPNFKYVDGVLYSADKTSLYFYPSEKTETSFVIPSGVQKIQSAAFLWNNNIQSITIPESVVFIGMAALQTNSITKLTFKDQENWYSRDENRLLSAAELENPVSYSEGQQRGICRDGIYKIQTETINITASQLSDTISAYVYKEEVFTTYKVTGEMSNEDYSQINQLIRDRGNNEHWKGSPITLDLSGVTDLTTLSYVSWPIASVTVPKTFSGVGVDTDYTNIIVSTDNPYYKYVDGSLYSADGTILYLYSSEKQDESFEIPSGVKKIWRFAFYNNKNIQNITIPESVVNIGWAAFDNDDTNIQTLTFKNKENWVANSNNNIVNPDNLEKVENFRWNSDTQTTGIFRHGLYKQETKTVTFTQMMTALNSYEAGTYTIYKVTGEMTYEDYWDVFDFVWDKVNNKKWENKYVGLDLSEVTGLTQIGGTWCFSTVIIPATVTEASDYSSGNIVGFESNPNFKYEDEILYTKDGTILCCYPREKTDKSFEIPSSVTKIWNSAFCNNYYIENITIPESVVYIGDCAFDNSNIKTLTFKDKENWMLQRDSDKVNPDDLENPANYRWNNQTESNGICRNGLFKPETKSVTVAQLTDEINSYAGGDYIIYKVTGTMSNEDYNTIVNLINNKRNNSWNYNDYVGLDLSAVTGLTKISYSWCLFNLAIPSSVSELSVSDGVYNVIISSDNPNFKYVDGSLYSADETILYLYSRAKTEETFEIPSKVKKIWAQAFQGNGSIRNIIIPEGVIYIGWGAFENGSIQTLTFKDKESWMVRNNNNNSESLVNPDDLENPANYRWNDQTQMNGICRNGLFKPETKSVTVSQLTNEINSYNGNDYITYKVTGSMSNDEYNQINQLINNKGNNENWEGRTIVLDLSGVTGLTKISYVSWPIATLTIPKTVSEVGNDTGFSKLIITSDNSYFTCVDGVIYSEDKTVLYSYSLEKTDESFEIPSTVTKIWREAFRYNYNIQSITIPESVVYIGDCTFDNSNIQTLTFKDKENWMVRGNNNSVSPVNPDDLENPANYRWNNQTQTNGSCRNGLFKPETKTVTVSQLTDEIDSYAGDDYIIYKVTGTMSNEDYNTIVNLINNKWNNSWNDKYVGLDLSAVTGLSEISYSWCLFSLAIPSSISKLNISSGVGNIIISSDNTNFKYVGGVLYSADGTILYRYPNGKTNESFVIPSTVKKICAEAFQSDSIQNITVSESVVYIGANAFGNSNIQTLIFENKEDWLFKVLNNSANKADPDALENPANYRWNNQTQTNGIFRQGLFKPESITVDVAELTEEIDSYAGGDYIIYKVTGEMSNAEYSTIVNFINDKRCNSWNYNNYVGLDLSEVTGLTEISNSGSLLCLIIPSSVTKLNNYVGAYNIIITSDNTHFKYVEGVFYSADETILYLYPKDKTDSSFVIPSTVTMIWCEAFWVNDSIQNITVPESVVYIGSGAFDNGNIQTLTFKDKQNWMASGNNSSVSPANPDDLENPANHRWNNRTQINGIFRQGLFKPETKNIAAEDLQSEINSFAGGNYIMYKVTGSMSNDEFIEIIRLLDQKRSNTWNYERYVGLDLSSVTGLTSAGNTDSVFYIVLPDSVQ
ncbi:MAG: leucine-rich repeat protein [Treponema sp.]|nr:leucine-rich repeat protein [Treponema sp.]